MKKGTVVFLVVVYVVALLALALTSEERANALRAWLKRVEERSRKAAEAFDDLTGK